MSEKLLSCIAHVLVIVTAICRKSAAAIPSLDLPQILLALGRDRRRTFHNRREHFSWTQPSDFVVDFATALVVATILKNNIARVKWISIDALPGRIDIARYSNTFLRARNSQKTVW